MRKSFNAIEPESKEKDPFGLNVQSVHYASYYYCIFFFIYKCNAISKLSRSKKP